jgi:predicted Zn-dependent protease
MLLPILALGIGLAFSPSARPAAPQESLAFWSSNYEIPDPDSNPQIAAAHRVFERLLRVAGSRPGVIPRLLVIKDKSLRVIALPDGGIVLSTGAINLCYATADNAEDRLAFVLAHEIAHQLKDDFWHMRFFQAIDSMEASGGACEGCRELASRTDDSSAKEMQADENAIVYSTMAGFDARAIVGKEHESFFKEWAAAMSAGRLMQETSGTHPSPAQRAQAVRTRLNAVLENLEAFELGVLFLESGMNGEAVLSFRTFLPHFPAREVYNNLAVAHYRVALDLYLLHIGRPTFAIDVIADPNSTAAYSLRDGETPPEFDRHIARAIEYFGNAISQDPDYLPAYLGLAASLILNDRPIDARAKLEQGLREAGEVPALFNALGAAFSADGSHERAAKQFQMALNLDPEFDLAIFNLAQLAEIRGEDDEASRRFGEFLERQSVGYWAEVARESLAGRSEASPGDFDLTDFTAFGKPDRKVSKEAIGGVEPGFYIDEVPKDWGMPTQASVHARETPYIVNRYPNGLVLVHFDDVVILLSSTAFYRGETGAGLRSGDEADDVKGEYGSPDSTAIVGDRAVWRYDIPGMAFRIRDGRILSWMIFLNKPSEGAF